MWIGVARACEESYRGYPYSGIVIPSRSRRLITEAFPVVETIVLPKILKLVPAYKITVRFYFENPDINIVFG